MAKWVNVRYDANATRSWVRVSLALKFYYFSVTFYSLVFIVICDLFSLTFILVITCTSLC